MSALASFDPLDLIAPANYGSKGAPHDPWRELRGQPLQKVSPSGYQPFWPVTRHADITKISAAPEDFSNEADAIVVWTDEQMAKAAAGEVSGLRQMRTVIMMDPPDHRMFRKVASGFFTPRGIERLDEIVTESARGVIDSLGPEGEDDFVSMVAQRHPLRVLGTILGITADQEERLLELTQQLLAGDDPDYQRDAGAEDRTQTSAELGAEFFEMFNAIIEDRRANPTDDLASMLANATLPDGEPLGLMETLGYYLIVFNAGHDTTRHSLAGAISAFLHNPDQLDVLRSGGDEVVTTAVEEVVRWTAPVNYMKRTALRDITLTDDEFGDVVIPEGDALALFYNAANRDDRVFDRAYDFDITRSPNRHLGFGWAEHYCLGAHLARASIAALLSEMQQRVELLEPAGDPTFTASSFVFGHKTLPVRYRIAPA